MPDGLKEALQLEQDAIVELIEREADKLSNATHANVLRAFALVLKSPVNLLAFLLDYTKTYNETGNPDAALDAAAAKFGVGLATGWAVGAVTTFFLGSSWPVWLGGAILGGAIAMMFEEDIDEWIAKKYEPSEMIGRAIAEARESWPAADRPFADDYVINRLSELLQGKTTTNELYAALKQVTAEIRAWAIENSDDFTDGYREGIERKDPTYRPNVDTVRDRLPTQMGDFPYDPSVLSHKRFATWTSSQM